MSRPSLAGKVAVVTGAARGVGAAIANHFASHAASVVTVDVQSRLLESNADYLRSESHAVTAVVADVSTSDGNELAVETALREYGGLDCFVANAAIQRFGKLADTSEVTWDEVQSVNLKGVYLGLRAAIPELVKRGGGSLILTGSVLGIVGDGDLAAYGAAKGGVRAMCRSVAVAYGAQKIRCNTICPGDVRTEILDEYLARAQDPEAELRRLASLYPLGRVAMTDDVAQAAVFLASDASAYITGTDIVVDGGLLAKVY